MEKGSYDEGMTISRDFEEREAKDTEKLYDIIKKAIWYVKEGNDTQREKATKFLLELFEPLVRKVSSKIFQYIKGRVDYADVLQETYTMFLSLLNRYNPGRSAFTYYIGVMLPQHMNRWVEREVLYNVVNIPVDMKEYSLADPTFSSTDSVSSYLNAYVLSKEYTAFIEQRSLRHSRSTTVHEVCHRYFLGRSSCSEIAKDLNISYHAVYEIIGKIKKELEQFFYYNIFSEYFISSTGIAEKEVTVWKR
jgi:RNA polymerase sigma factor (sigma-70 family)